MIEHIREYGTLQSLDGIHCAHLAVVHELTPRPRPHSYTDWGAEYRGDPPCLEYRLRWMLSRAVGPGFRAFWVSVAKHSV